MTVLIVVSHPDDEILGCGATIVRHITEGDEVYAVTLTRGLGIGVREGVTEEDISRRKVHAYAAAEALGFTWHAYHDYPDLRMDSVDLLDVAKTIERSIEDLQPELIYTHHSADMHIDHDVVYRATMTATRPLPGQTVKEVRLMEVPSSTEFSLEPFIPNLWMEITLNQLHQKMTALTCYVDEARKEPHPRSIPAVSNLAARRGYESGFLYAEAFNVARRLI